MGYDLILQGGRLLDPAQTIDRVTDVAFADGVVLGGRMWHGTNRSTWR